MDDKFVKYKEYKQRLSLEYKGYPMEKILSVDIASIAYGMKTFKLRSLLIFFTTLKIDFPVVTKDSVLYSMGNYKRKDYYSILDYVRQQASGELIDFNEIRRSPKINLVNIFKSLKHAFVKGAGLSIKEKLMLATSYAYIMNFIDDIEKNKNKFPGAYVSFCSSHIHEAVIDIFFQKNDIPTFTLQHGLYFIFKNITIDAICYENFISNKLLCWGGYTKDEFVDFGVPEDRMAVVGYPGTFKKLSKRVLPTNYRVLVFLARHLFHDNNIRILEIISILKNKSNIIFDVKLHPSLHPTHYIPILNEYNLSLCRNDSIKSLLESGEYDMTISYNSTAYYDSYMNNCVSLRYIDADADGSINVLDDDFTDVESLTEKISTMRNDMCTDIFWERVVKRMEYISGFNINSYGIEISKAIKII